MRPVWPGGCSSAGLLGEGQPAPPEAVSVMAGYGLDVSRHRSRLMTADELGAASLVLAMAREHVRHAVVTEPAAWPRAFTLKEIVRRGQQAGPRASGESLADWRPGCTPAGNAPRCWGTLPTMTCPTPWAVRRRRT